MMSEADIIEYHKLTEKLELLKKKGTPVDDRGPNDLTKQIDRSDLISSISFWL